LLRRGDWAPRFRPLNRNQRPLCFMSTSGWRASSGGLNCCRQHRPRRTSLRRGDWAASGSSPRSVRWGAPGTERRVDDLPPIHEPGSPPPSPGDSPNYRRTQGGGAATGRSDRCLISRAEEVAMPIHPLDGRDPVLPSGGTYGVGSTAAPRSSLAICRSSLRWPVVTPSADHQQCLYIARKHRSGKDEK